MIHVNGHFVLIAGASDQYATPRIIPEEGVGDVWGSSHSHMHSWSGESKSSLLLVEMLIEI